MIDGTITKSAPKIKRSAWGFFSPFQLVLTPRSTLLLHLFFFSFKSLEAEPRISMCHNNNVYLFPTPVCSIISYQLNLASTWCSSMTSPVRNPICSSLCDAWEVREGEKKRKKKKTKQKKHHKKERRGEGGANQGRSGQNEKWE